MNAKIKDVAKRAGVSIATVSNALSGRKNVSPEKHAAVMAAVQELGYIPNINARLLKARQTGNIGLSLPYIDGPFYTMLIQEIYHACADNGYDMLMHVSSAPDSRSAAAKILSCNIDAAIILNDHLRNDEAETLVKRRLPLVFMDREFQAPGVSSVLIDNRMGTEQQVAYLAHTGHRRIAYLRGADTFYGNARYETFLQVMRAARLPIDESLILDGDVSRKVAYNCTHFLLRSQRESMPDAFLCANDEMAMGCIAALTDLGYAVPKEVSVLGFDDIEAKGCNPPLTTIAYSLHSFAHKAVEEAMRLIEDPQGMGSVTTVPTELVLRQSAIFRYGDLPGLHV